jgi:hypothetical protein
LGVHHDASGEKKQGGSRGIPLMAISVASWCSVSNRWGFSKPSIRDSVLAAASEFARIVTADDHRRTPAISVDRRRDGEAPNSLPFTEDTISAMSSSIRDPKKFFPGVRRGLVCQGERIVGGVDLPADTQRFLDDFNREYAAAGLRLIPAAHAAEWVPASPI